MKLAILDLSKTNSIADLNLNQSIEISGGFLPLNFGLNLSKQIMQTITTNLSSAQIGNNNINNQVVHNDIRR